MPRLLPQPVVSAAKRIARAIWEFAWAILAVLGLVSLVFWLYEVFAESKHPVNFWLVMIFAVLAAGAFVWGLRRRAAPGERGAHHYHGPVTQTIVMTAGAGDPLPTATVPPTTAPEITAHEIDHALRVGPTGNMFYATDHSTLKVALELTNGSARALNYWPEIFTVNVGDRSHPLSAIQGVEDIAPSATDTWYGAPVPIVATDWPIEVTLIYRICYGPHNGQMLRALTGSRRTTPISLPGDGEVLQGLWNAVQPARDDALSAPFTPPAG